MKKKCTNFYFLSLLEKLRITDKTYFIKSSKQFAFCLGIINPKIYISTSLVALLSEREIEAVLRHERYHLKNHDTQTMLVASIVASLLPFFPLLSDFLSNYQIDREIKADQEAILGLGNEKPLITVLKKMLRAPSVAMVSVAAIANQDTLEPRILMLVKKDKPFKKFKLQHIFISICSVFVMGTITFTPVQAFEIHHQGQNLMMICSTGNSLGKIDHSEGILYSPMK